MKETVKSETWEVFGYKNGKGKRPKSMGKVYWGDIVNKPEALRRATNMFCFSAITDVVATKYTRYDAFVEGMHDMRWLWLPALSVIGGIVLGIHFNIIWPVIIGWVFGLSYGISHAPHSPV